MASNTIPHKDIILSAKSPLNDTKTQAAQYSQACSDLFSPLGAIVEPLTKATASTTENIARFIVDGGNIMEKHPAPPKSNITDALSKCTSHHATRTPESLIGMKESGDPKATSTKGQS